MIRAFIAIETLCDSETFYELRINSTISANKILLFPNKHANCVEDVVSERTTWPHIDQNDRTT